MGFLAVTGIVAIALVITLIEVPGFRKKKQKKELWVFATLLLLGIVLNVSVALHLHVPNPYDWISVIYKPMNDVMIGLLK